MKKGLNAFSKLYTRHRKKKKTLTSLENPFFKTKRKKKIIGSNLVNTWQKNKTDNMAPMRDFLHNMQLDSQKRNVLFQGNHR